MMNVAVLGGGIAGLSAAYRLSKAGAQVTLFEASDRLGGLGTWFHYQDMRLDRFYHVILDSDTYLLALLEELGLSHRVGWSQTQMGFFVRGRCYPFNSPMDLLRFKALSLPNRIRTGMAALYITKLKRNGRPLDDQPASDWLRKLFGKRVYSTIWEPLLIAKFGDLRDKVPAYWVWNTLNREKDGSQEVKGYVRGGYALIADALAESIQNLGGSIRMQSPVQSIEDHGRRINIRSGDDSERYDAVLSTLPLPLLRRACGRSLQKRIPLANLDFQGVVNVLLVRKQPLDRYYWNAVVDSDFPFQGIVETTHVINPQWIGDRHLIYVMNYCSPDSDAYTTPDVQQRRLAIKGLQHLYPDFYPSSIEASFVFRAPRVEPVWTRGYLNLRPPPQIDGAQLYLATTAQAYPMVTSWNTSVRLAEDAVSAMLSGAAESDRVGQDPPDDAAVTMGQTVQNG